MSDFERSASFRKPAVAPARDEEFDDSLFDQAAADATPADGREGLPPTFRMRHDEHYVDQITARAGAAQVQMIAVRDIDGAHPFGAPDLGPLVDSISSFGILQPLLVRRRSGRYDLIAGSKRLAAAIAAGLVEVPCLLQNADDERARALADAENVRCGESGSSPHAAAAQAGLPVGATSEIIDSLAAIESCLNLFLDRERPLRERVSLELMRAEAHRARWLAQAYLLLSGNPSLRKEVASPASLVEDALKGLEAEGRLAGVGTSLAVDEFTRTVFVDSRLMSVALTGAIGAMLALLQEADGGTLKVRVSTHPATRLVVFQFAQDIVPAPEV
ncbi:MAG: ParB N-terminal domain-containing protein, partial [Acidobacteria bacterium]|nr:ParB N-terminal domain-containing protein [Acidobacteriota bacterium]